MRKLIFILSLFFSLAVHAQNNCWTALSSDGVSLIGGLEHLAPTNPFGKKDPWIIYLHGIDHRRAHPISFADTSRISVIEAKGVPKLTATNPLPLFHQPGGGPTDYYRYNVIAPQADIDDNQWKLDALTVSLARIKTHAATTDTSKVLLVCYSLGGGGGFSLLKYIGVYPNISFVVIVGGGYINTADYVTLAASGISIEVFSSIGDQLAATSLSDTWVNGINAQKPVNPINYYRMSDISPSNSPTDHDKILQIIIEDTTAGDTYALTNGDMWTRDETIYQRGLRYVKQRPHR